MIWETCRLYPDCELKPLKEGEKCPYFGPKERLQLTFTEEGWKMGE